MSFFPVKYFLAKFFPAAWFSGGEATAGPQFGDMAATMAGSGVMSGSIRATGVLRCTLAGSGSMSGDLSANVLPEVSANDNGGFVRQRSTREWPVFVNIAVTMTGTGTMIGDLQAIANMSSTMSGSGTMRAMLVADITGLLKRRAEEEQLALILALAA